MSETSAMIARRRSILYSQYLDMHISIVYPEAGEPESVSVTTYYTIWVDVCIKESS